MHDMRKIEIIENHEIETQDELADILRKMAFM